MVDMMNALVTFQDIWDNKPISTMKGLIHKDITLYTDRDTGIRRWTYLIIDNDEIKAIAVFGPTDPLNGVAALQVGWAVSPPHRGKGLAKKLVRCAIAELDNGFRKAGSPMFYVEASVLDENEASISVAKSVFGEPVEAGKDERTGKPLQLFRTLKGKRPFEA